MRAIDGKMHEIRQRFVQGLLMDMDPQELRAFVTGQEDDAEQRVRNAA